MTGLMMTIKGIPSTYNKDLQESVEPMLEHVKTLKDSLLIATRVLSTLTTSPANMLAALSPDMLATDIAEYLVRKGTLCSRFCLSRLRVLTVNPGLPFRETHHISGRVVALAEKEGVPMDKLSIQQLQGVDSRFGSDVLEVFNYERSVEMNSAIGGTSKSAVQEQIKILQSVIKAS
jgi:argininosuccinate lyase